MNRIIILALLLSNVSYANTRRLQNADFATSADLTGAGGTVSQLLNTSKIYDSTNAQLLDTTIAAKLNSSAFTDAAVTGKLLTGYSSGAGVVSSSDSILQAIQKLNGNIAAIVPSTSAISASDIDWSTLHTTGGLYTKTLSANTTFTFSNKAAGDTIVVRLTNTASNYTVTWPTVKWSGGTTPTMTTGAKSDVYTFIYDGTDVFGSVVQNF